jgi:hypothetical protein
MIDPVHNRKVDAVGGAEISTRLAPALRCAEGLLLRGENAGAFHRDVDAQLLVRQLGGILDRGHADILAVHDHVIAFDSTLPGSGHARNRSGAGARWFPAAPNR